MTDTIEQIQAYSKQALASIQQHELSPTPENYAIWFHHAMGHNKELSHEINSIIGNKLRFTLENCLYLYNKYVVGENKAADIATHGAEKVLAEVLKVITDFGGETSNYNKDVNTYLDNITQKFEDGNVKEMVRELISATAVLKKSGEKINKRLEESKKEIHSLKENLQKVTQESQRDFLTGVYNRKTFEHYADEQMALSKQNHTDLCLIMIDIDHFKKFNDTYGHLLGDEVLKIVARALTDTLKGRDAVARFGGEEFVAILPETPIEGAFKVAEVIRKAIATKELKNKSTGENYGTITVSIGLSHFRPTSDTLPTLVKRADDALYHSKRNGRNQVTKEHA